MKLSKATIEKINELELEFFEENIQRAKDLDEWCDYWRGKVGVNISWEVYNAGIQDRGPIPYFGINACTRIKDSVTEITDAGDCTMTWHLEWDLDQARFFKGGIQWAIDNGLEVPSGVFEAAK